MREKLRCLMEKKSFHISMMIIIVTVILFALGMVTLRYNVEGETNMPFEITKIAIISTSEGKDKNVEGHKWAFDINQNNDIYVYIQKNENFQKQEAIKNIYINNIKIERAKEIGIPKIYRPNSLEVGGAFYNAQENVAENLEYKGALNTNFVTMDIANQGGILAFRFAVDKIAEYISDETEINHNMLLEQTNIKEEDLQAKLSCDFTIKTESGKEYKTTLKFELPIEGILENGTTHKVIENTEDIIFKRVKN